MAEPGVVIFTEGPPTDWRRAALSLANACPGLTYGDAARACRFSQGFLDLVLAPAQLEAAAAALVAAGSPASVLASSERVVVPPAFTPLRIGIDDLGLSCLEPHSPAYARIPWRRVRMLHLGLVGPTQRSRGVSAPELDPLVMVEGPRARREPDAPSQAAPAELWFEVVLSEPFARLRIRMSSFVYDCLNDPADRAEENLRRVIELIVQRAPRANKAGLIDQPLDDAEAMDEHGNDRAVSWALTRLKIREGAEFTPAPPVEPELIPAEAPDSLDGVIGLLSRFRRVVLLSSSIGLSILGRVVLLQKYPGLPGRMIWPIQLALWVPIVLMLSVLYVGVQMRLDTVKERRNRV